MGEPNPHQDSPAEQILGGKHVVQQDLVLRVSSRDSDSFVGKPLSELESINAKEVKPGQGIAILTENGTKWILIAEENKDSWFKRAPKSFTLYGDPLNKYFGVDKLEHVLIRGSSPGGGDKSLHVGMVTQHAELDITVPRQQLGRSVLKEELAINQIILTGQIKGAAVFNLKDWEYTDPLQAITQHERTSHDKQHWPPGEWQRIANLQIPPIQEHEVKSMVGELIMKGYHLGPGENADRIISKMGKPISKIESVADFCSHYLIEYNETHSVFSLARAAGVAWWAERLDNNYPLVSTQ